MTSPLAFLDVGGPELLMIMFAILLLFGGERLPGLARGLGRSIREFKRASAGVEEEIRKAIETAPDPKPKKPASNYTPPAAAVMPAPGPTPAQTEPKPEAPVSGNTPTEPPGPTP